MRLQTLNKFDENIVSVIIPVFNQEEFISEAIESILAQNIENIEIVMIDDGSNDGTRLILENISKKNRNIYVYAHENNLNKGYSASFNLGFEKSRGRYIATIGGDDIYLSGAIGKMKAEFDKRHNMTPAFVCGKALVINKNGKETGEIQGTNFMQHANPFESILQYFSICTPTMMFERSVLEKEGLYDTELVYGDWEIALRLASEHEMIFIDDFLVKYRIHDRNTCIEQSLDVELIRTKPVFDKLLNLSSGGRGKIGNTRAKSIINLKLAYWHYMNNEKDKSQTYIAESAKDLNHGLITADYAEWLSRLKYNSFKQDYSSFVEYLVFHLKHLSEHMDRKRFKHIIAQLTGLESRYSRSNPELFFIFVKKIISNFNTGYSIELIKGAVRNIKGILPNLL